MQENSPASAQHKKVIKTKMGDHKSVFLLPLWSEKIPTGISINVVTNEESAKTAVAKAEAKYEHDLKQINQKDKQFDLSLSKLETERTALTTEYESVKKVIEENIERTFGIFS